MNLEKELDRLTAPPSAAGKVKVLTRDEVAQLVAQGAVTPVERIPRLHMARRESVPSNWVRGSVFRYPRRRDG